VISNSEIAGALVATTLVAVGGAWGAAAIWRFGVPRLAAHAPPRLGRSATGFSAAEPAPSGTATPGPGWLGRRIQVLRFHGRFLTELSLASFGGAGTAGFVTVALVLLWGGKLGAEPTSADDPVFAAALLGTVAAHLAMCTWAWRLGYPLGLVRPSLRGLALGVAGGVAAVLFTATWSQAFVWLGAPLPDQGLVGLFDDAGAAARARTSVFIVLAAPLLEELSFRGFLQGALRARIGPMRAIVTVGAVFGMLHLADPWVVPPLVAVGMIFGVIRERTGSVWPCVLAHVLNNSVALLA
jgi:membrane protease YdiL (CAAX protease family)